MKSKKPLTDEELEKFESTRDLGAELLASVNQMLGVSLRTLQEWEQGRRQPSGAAKTLIAIAERRPEVLRDFAL